jgi:putative flippase GtrA
MNRDLHACCRTLGSGREMPISLRRLMVFNVVGAFGFAVQLAALALLVSGLKCGYLAATALAVEAAVIHNFFWHEHWTWADRPDPGWTHSLRRFIHFNLTNGAISIVGNLICMRVFMGTLPVNYLEANIMAIAVCAVFNFIASDRLVFRTRPRRSQS